ncbi:MAG: 5'/3'-nucleotidase SurE, partial [Caldilineaceae bacterium]|nr:5'/3'-nucleotidase SurE [Caldilineaceae bacterium]
APGIQALAEALDEFGSVFVVAPDRNWSAAGHPKTLHKPLRVQQVTWLDGRKALACSGAPSDCVALALLGLISGPIDLVVSGVNSNYNLATDVFYSGTVAGAMEACISDIPAIAFSMGPAHDSPVPEDKALTHAGFVAADIVRNVFAHGMPPHVMLNVNIPWASAERFRGIEVTRLGQRIYRDALVKADDPWGRPYYWIGGELPIGVPDDGTDIGAVENGIVSVTPLGVDLTRHDFRAEMAGWSFAKEASVAG